MTKSPRSCDRPFPRCCPDCGKVEVQPVTIPYDAEVKHDGRLHKFQIPALHVNKCAACGEISFGNVADDEISEALREHLKLLSPQQIREKINTLGLKQKEFGKQIRVAPETISRWLSGTHIQSRAMDMLMRMFFAFGSERSNLASSMSNRNLGAVQTAESLAIDKETGEVTLVTVVAGELRNTIQWNTPCEKLGIPPAERAPMAAESNPTMAAESNPAAESNLAMAA